MDQRVTTVDISSFILCFLGGAAAMIIAAAAFYSAVLEQTSNNRAASAWATEDVVDNSLYTPQQVVVPPILGDAVAGAQGACGCPGCCSVLNS